MNLFNRIFELRKENHIKQINSQILKQYNKGNILFELHKFEESLIAFESAEHMLNEEREILKENNNQFEKSNNLLISIWSKESDLYYYLDNYEQSLLFLDKILEEKPSNANYLFKKGFLLYKIGHCETALEYFQEVLDIKYEYSEAWYYMGIILDMFKKYDMAHRAFDNAILYSKPEYFPFPKFTWFSYLSTNQLKYDTSEIWVRKSKIFFKQSDFENALHTIDRALEIKSTEEILIYKNKLIKEIEKRNIN